MNEDLKNKVPNILERITQLSKQSAIYLETAHIGEWVAQRISSGQDISLADLNEWIAELCSSENAVIQAKGKNLSEWLSKCHSKCS